MIYTLKKKKFCTRNFIGESRHRLPLNCSVIQQKGLTHVFDITKGYTYI